MMRSIRLVGAYSRRSFLGWSAFRSFLFTLVINQAVAPLLGLAIWSAALPDTRGVSAYFVALLAVQLATVSQEYYSVTMHIYEGALNDDLLKPHSFAVIPLGESFAARLWHLLMGLPLVALAMIVTGVGFDSRNVLMALPALVLAGALRFVFTYILCLSALWVQQAGAITDYGSTLVFLLGGMAAPIMFFPERFRPIGEALPFRSMLGFPAEVASGNLSDTQVLAGYGWQVLWLAVFVPLAMFVWRTGIRHYTALGG